MMYKTILPIFIVLSIGLSGPAMAANCYADYKAKKDNPLRLHYGVVELRGACSKGSAKSEIAARLSGQGWTLLNVMAVFGPEGLKQRKGNAGRYYLRF
ncbi:hypothetical protein [Epibacterium ulvae]|uniref:hypothetical protein n=1 Tax=Epibacterium ulvae TaxID=1156985 RepID=UPI002492C12A|nr:hypothetical protein [Epibacterium ulvae]